MHVCMQYIRNYVHQCCTNHKTKSTTTSKMIATAIKAPTTPPAIAPADDESLSSDTIITLTAKYMQIYVRMLLCKRMPQIQTLTMYTYIYVHAGNYM